MNRQIDFMNLSRQYKDHRQEFLEVIEKVCSETAFSGGKYVEKFEAEFAAYLGAEYCCCVNSGTDAIFLAMKALGIQKDDEVIIPVNTFIASAWGVVYVGAKPIFVDCTSDTWEIDALKIKEKITDKTKAIIGVHLYGQPFDFDKVKEVADQYDLFIVEDCAQAHGAVYKGKKAGTLGDLACFSFYPGKNLGAFGEGGAVVTNNKDYHCHINKLKNHGSETKYYHEMIGYNKRMDGIQGAILSTKLRYLDQWNLQRKHIAERYLQEIHNPKIIHQSILQGVRPVYHLYEVQADNAEQFMGFLKGRGINSARHYPIPCHLQNAFKYLGYKKSDFPQAEKLSRHCVSLPMFPELNEAEVSYVIEMCNAYGEL